MAYNKAFENPYYAQQEMMDGIYKKSVERLKKDEVNPEDFRDLYGDENVDRDLQEVKRLEAIISKDSTHEEREALKLSTILEGIIHYHGEQSNWFGMDAQTFKTSRYDDLKNGTDGVVEFVENENPQHLAFGIDATYGHYSDKKIKRILERIKKGDMARIKYFDSDASHFRGELKMVPLFVVAIGPERITEVAELWAENQKDALAIHPVQMQILEELMVQSVYFSMFADQEKQPEIAKKYKNIRDKISGIVSQKRNQGIQTDHDSLFDEIVDILVEKVPFPIEDLK